MWIRLKHPGDDFNLYRTHLVLDGVALKLYYVVLQVVIAEQLGRFEHETHALVTRLSIDALSLFHIRRKTNLWEEMMST